MTGRLKAAMGKVNVTPEETVSLQGYDPDTNIANPETDVLDDLFARILILDDGASRRVFIGFDCCLSNEETVKVADPEGKPGRYREFIPTFPEHTRAEWGAAAGVQEDQVSVNPTHTHTAPASFSEKYTSRVAAKIRELIQELVPVTIYASTAEGSISAFRRPTLHADHSVPINRTLNVLDLKKDDGASLGYIVNYAVHPTGVRNPTSRISSDIVGLAMSTIEDEKGEGFVSLFLQGFSGDVCPTYGDNGPTGDTYPDVQQGAAVFSSEISEALSEQHCVQTGPIQTGEHRVDVPTRSDFYKENMTVKLVGTSIGELAILSVSGEVFNDYIDKTESLSPFRYTLLSGIANGYAGYIPTYEAFHDGLGGYELNTTPYSDAVEDTILKETKEILTKLKNS